MRLLDLALAVGLLAPASEKAPARTMAAAGPPDGRPPQRQSRRRVERRHADAHVAPVRSPQGDHVCEAQAGVVLVDGRRVHPLQGTVEVVTPPAWRADGEAVAWIERGAGETRLVVLPELTGPGAEPLSWTLPPVLGGERINWAGKRRVVVGPELLQPRAVASWTE